MPNIIVLPRRTRYQLPPAQGNLLAWWDASRERDYADGGTLTTLHDWSGNGADATGVNSPTWHAAYSGFPAWRLQSSSTQYFTFSDTGFPTGAITVCAAFYPATFPGLRPEIFGYGAGLYTEWHMGIGRSTQGRYPVLRASGGDAIGSTSIVTGAWQTLTITEDGSDNVAFYVDGAAAGTATQANDPSVPGDGRIGYFPEESDQWDGYMRKILVWNKRLSAAELGHLNKFLEN